MTLNPIGSKAGDGVPSSAGPFQIINDCHASSAGQPAEPPRRRYDCSNYEDCLNLAAALNWDSFTCRGCWGAIDKTLLWRAWQVMRRDNIAREICDIPHINVHLNVHCAAAGADEKQQELGSSVEPPKASPHSV